LNGNPQKLPDPIFFLDRTHGKAMHRLLTRVGFRVLRHSNYFVDEERDPIWLSRCGKENWIVLSGDKAIERVPENRQAAIDAKCKILFLDDTNSRGEEWAAAVIVGRLRLFEIIGLNNGPLFVTIAKQARSHISSVRFAGDGGPKPAPPMAAISGDGETPKELPSPTRDPQQGNLKFK